MIHGYHATFGTYGSHLPNDPRGSKSEFVGSRRLYESAGRAKTADKSFDQLTEDEREVLTYTQGSLSRPVVMYDETQVAVIGAAIGSYVRRHRV